MKRSKKQGGGAMKEDLEIVNLISFSWVVTHAYS